MNTHTQTVFPQEDTDAIEGLWSAAEAAFQEAGGLAVRCDQSLHKGLERIGCLYDRVTLGSNDPVTAWWRWLNGKKIDRPKGVAGKSRFQAVVKHLSGGQRDDSGMTR